MIESETGSMAENMGESMTDDTANRIVDNADGMARNGDGGMDESVAGDEVDDIRQQNDFNGGDDPSKEGDMHGQANTESKPPQNASGVPVNLRVILASSSPRRRELLKDADVKFEVLIPSAKIDEHIDQDLLIEPQEVAKKLAEKKAGAAVQELLADNPNDSFFVIGADTVVVCDGEIFGKPRNLGDATRMLKALSGRTHEVITGVSLWMILAGASDDISVACRTFADMSRVTFKPLTDEEIADYLRKGESFDKAGAYAIQGEGAALVDHYEGALDTIIGLPVSKLLEDFPELRSNR